MDKCGGKPIKAVIEHVRDGSTLRAFLLPDFYHITLMISGIRVSIIVDCGSHLGFVDLLLQLHIIVFQCPGFKLDNDGKPDPTAKVPYAEEAKYFVESRLLQRDVEIILESVNNNNFVGSVIHPVSFTSS